MSNVSGYGGNLTYPVRPLLFNSVGVDDLGWYTDTIANQKVLIFKKAGLQIRKLANTSMTVIAPTPGEYKAVRLVVKPVAPCEDCNYEYGIVVDKKVKRPGVNNSDYYPTGRFYGDKFYRIGTPSGGYLPAADIAKIEETIIQQITDDKGGGMENSLPAIVGAKKYYIINDTKNDDLSGFTVTWPDGTTTVFETEATFAAGKMGVDFNAKTTAAYGGAAFNALLVAYRIGTDQYLITALEDGLNFSIGTHVTSEVVEKGILLTAKDKEIQFNIKADPAVFQIKGGVNLVKITPTAWTAGAITLKVDGTAKTNAAIATNQSTTVGNINTRLGGDGFALPHGANSAVIALATTKKKLVVGYANASEGVVDYNRTSKPSFPTLTSDDVFKEFSQLRHLGSLLSMVHDEKPIKGEEYVKINFTVDMSGHGNMHGASHGNDYRIGHTVYIKKSVYDDATNKWKDDTTYYMNAAGADKNLKELFAAWIA